MTGPEANGKLPPVKFTKSGWMLVRAVTNNPKTFRFASTGPYYVEIGYQRRVSKESAQFFLDWVYERARQIKLDDADAAARSARVPSRWPATFGRRNWRKRMRSSDWGYRISACGFRILKIA